MAAERNDQTLPEQQGAGKPDVPNAAPRLPHERDESSDNQESAAPRAIIEQAHDDLVAGRKDTDRGTPADEAYQKQKTPGTGS